MGAGFRRPQRIRRRRRRHRRGRGRRLGRLRGPAHAVAHGRFRRRVLPAVRRGDRFAARGRRGLAAELRGSADAHGADHQGVERPPHAHPARGGLRGADRPALLLVPCCGAHMRLAGAARLAPRVGRHSRRAGRDLGNPLRLEAGASGPVDRSDRRPDRPRLVFARHRKAQSCGGLRRGGGGEGEPTSPERGLCARGGGRCGGACARPRAHGLAGAVRRARPRRPAAQCARVSVASV